MSRHTSESLYDLRQAILRECAANWMLTALRNFRDQLRIFEHEFCNEAKKTSQSVEKCCQWSIQSYNDLHLAMDGFEDSIQWENDTAQLLDAINRLRRRWLEDVNRCLKVIGGRIDPSNPVSGEEDCGARLRAAAETADSVGKDLDELVNDLDNHSAVLSARRKAAEERLA